LFFHLEDFKLGFFAMFDAAGWHRPALAPGSSLDYNIHAQYIKCAVALVIIILSTGKVKENLLV